jgi:uncharacterized protein with PQ loop repeat
MHGSSLQLLAGFASTTIFISSNLPMLFKAFKTKDLSSYSLGHLVLGNLGNAVYWLYVISLPLGPVWFLQIFFSMASALMLFCYLRYERNWFRLEREERMGREPGTGDGGREEDDGPWMDDINGGLSFEHRLSKLQGGM